MKMKKLLHRRTLLRLGGGTLVAGGATAIYASQIEPAWLDVTPLSLHLPDLDPAFHGYRIAQITDIHADTTWMNTARLMDVVTLMNQQKPDLIVITGDFVTHIDESTPRTLAALRHLKARDGVLAVLGNHDHWTNATIVRQILKLNNVKVLDDTFHTLQRGHAMLHIVGLDDLWPKNLTPVWSHKPRLKRVLANLPSQGAAILLVHEPDFADVAASTGRIGLQLSGHSHGGQVRMPFYGVIHVPPLSQKYPDGLYHVKQMLHYTNRGVGMVPVQVRFNCRPEISLFTLSNGSP